MTISTDVVLGVDIGTTSSKAVARLSSRDGAPYVEQPTPWHTGSGGQTGHADAAHADRSPRRSGRLDRAPDQVYGHVDDAVRIDLGLPAASAVPWGALLHVRSAPP